MIKTLLATAVIGGAALAVAAPASAGKHDHHADTLCAAPWHWNGPLSLLRGDHGYVACTGAGRGSDISVLDDACAAPWRSDGPLEIVTVDRVACDG